MPALPPRPRTVGGCTMKTLASRMRRPSSPRETFGQRAGRLLGRLALAPVLQADEALARALVAAGAAHHVVEQHFLLLGQIGLQLLHHDFQPLAGGAGRHAHLDLQATLVFIGQEGGRQALVHPAHGSNHQAR